MKILYVAIMYDQGNPARGYSFEHINFYQSLLALDGSKHQIVYFPFDVMMQNEGRRKMNQTLLELARKEKPDLCFVGMLDNEIKKETLKKIRALDITTLGWFGDDHWRFDSYSKYYAPYFSWIATTDPTASERYKKIGYNNAIYAPSAANTDIFKPSSNEKNIDVSFVGSWTQKRGEIINSIIGSGIPIKVYGSGWPNGRVNDEELVKIISESKISINLNPSSSYFGLKPFTRLFFKRTSFNRSIFHIKPDFWNFFANIREWQQKSIPQLKARVFEIPACRTMLITQNVAHLEDHYNLGTEIISYSDTRDLIEKIKYYLLHDIERENIAQHGYERTIRDHSYKKRFRDLFTKMGF